MPVPELFPDDPDTKYFSRGSRQRNYVINGGASLKISSEFYFGFGISHDVKPWRSAGARGARAALELPAGTARRLGLEIGDVLSILPLEE